MQPQNINAHQRVKYEPTIRKRGIPCRLFGKNFYSVAQAARHEGISYSWAKEMIDKGMHKESKPKRQIHKGYRARWRTKHEVVDTNHANAG